MTISENEESSAFLLQFIAVGLLWGATNPFIREGTLVARKRTGNAVLVHLTTPRYIVPQLLNLSGSVLFAAILRHPRAQLSLAVPLANGTSILANALVDWVIGGRQNREDCTSASYLCGVACLALGVFLCSE
jgi:hypothetical protein